MHSDPTLHRDGLESHSSQAYDQAPHLSLLAQLLEYGERIHGGYVSNFCETFPIFDSQLICDHNGLLCTTKNYSSYAPTHGDSRLLDAIVERDTSRLRLPDLTRDNVLICQGAQHGLSLTLSTLTKYISQVHIAVPSYTGYSDICQSLGLPIVPYRLGSYEQLDVSELVRSLRPGSMLILNTPHNPAGDMLSAEQLSIIARRARELRAFLVFDVVYDNLIYEGANPNWEFGHEGLLEDEPFIWINSFSKNYGLPGLRIGWITGAGSIITRLTTSMERSMISAPTFSQKFAATALKWNLADEIRALSAKRDLICARLSRIPGVNFRKPLAGTVILAELPGIDTTRLCYKILEAEALVLLPGVGYFGGSRSSIRLPFGYPIYQIERAIDLLEEALLDL